MKYLIIGTGGTGGSIGSLLSKAGRDVTVIARGKHLEELKSKGLSIYNPKGESFTVHPKATDMEHYTETPDVIFVCVKGYSLESTIPFMQKVTGKDTVIIPILNIFGTGKRLQERLPGILVTEACIYVSATIKEPGVIEMYMASIRIFFGTRNNDEYRPVLQEIESDLNTCGIKAVNSTNIQRDTMEKYCLISPLGATAAYFACPIGDMQKEGKPRDCYIELIKELLAISEAQGINFEKDILEENLKRLDATAPDATVSLLRDLQSGHEAEIDGQVFNVVRMGKELKVPVPEYEKIAAKFGYKE